MANKEIDVKAVCPFYRREGHFTITCEGVMGRDTVNVFERIRDKVRQEKRFCCGAWESCPLARTVMGKYEDEKRD